MCYVYSKCVGAGRYICPDGITCIANADAYTTCPGLRNTHLDWTLPVETYNHYHRYHGGDAYQLMVCMCAYLSIIVDWIIW